jgi:hypothetical protein
MNVGFTEIDYIKPFIRRYRLLKKPDINANRMLHKNCDDTKAYTCMYKRKTIFENYFSANGFKK